MRGLKYSHPPRLLNDTSVAPYTGAWIEIYHKLFLFLLYNVAPYTGAGIEIKTQEVKNALEASHPTRVRGLK